MVRTIGMAEAKSKLSDLVGRAAYGGERFILERRGRPVAILIGLDDYRRLQELEQAAHRQPLPPELYHRQEELVAQARLLRARLGDPVKGLAELMSTLPPEEAFWLQLAEGTL